LDLFTIKKTIFLYCDFLISFFFFFFFFFFGTKVPNKPLLNLVTHEFTPKDHKGVLYGWIILFNKLMEIQNKRKKKKG
jgi:hypothetical protein